MFEKLVIPDVVLIHPRKIGDERGFFSETYNRRTLSDCGIDCEFVQDNHSKTGQIGTIRGLHFQSPPYAQAKLVRVARGSILDVAVDIRRSSPTFGRHVSAIISAEAWNQIFLPLGFAHGFITLEPDTEVVYKTSDFYSAEHDRGLAWDDPALKIDWHLGEKVPLLSEKDRRHPTLAELNSPFD